MKNFKQKLKGYSLAELVLAIGIFAIISSMLVLLVIDSTRTLENTYTRSKATQLTREVYSTLIMLKSDSWYNVARHTGEGNKYIDFVDGVYEILDGEITNGNLTYYFLIDDVYRDLDKNITTEVLGTLDPHSRLIDIYISWTDRLGRVNIINPKIYINDWNTNSISWSTKEDFDTGQFDETMSQNILGGEIRLFSMKYSDWCNPTLGYFPPYDLTKSGVASAIHAIDDYVYMGTGENASGPPFAKISVMEGEPPIVDELGTWDNSPRPKTYAVHIVNGFAFLGSENPWHELIVLDITSSSNIFTQYTSLNLPNPKNRNRSIYSNGNYGYITHDNRITVFRIDNLQQDVTPTVVSTITVGGNNTVITDLFVDDDYIYVSAKGSTDDFFILRNQSPFSLLGSRNVGSMNITSLFISEDTNRAYLGAESNASYEFFILDTSNKATAYPIVIAKDLGAMSVTNLVASDQKVMIGGVGGERYVVYDIADELNPYQCSDTQKVAQLNLPNINNLSLVKKGNNLYTYILTQDTNAELQIMRGGPGGGGPDGEGYVEYGEYLSEIFDSESENAEYYIMDLKTSIPTGTSLEIQLRVSNSSTMTGSIWIGPDGTSNTFYSDTGIYDLPLSLVGRYFQYKVIFKSNTINTPLLEEIVINYEK